MEMIVELETEKVTTEIPSPAEGVLLKILVKKNDVVKVGTTIAWIGQPGEALNTDAYLIFRRTSPARASTRRSTRINSLRGLFFSA